MRGRLARSGSRPEGKRCRRLALGILAASLAAITAACCVAATAGAVIVQLPGRTISYLPVRRSREKNSTASKGPLVYHGGPVMSSNTNYTLYWDPSGAPDYPAGYQAGIDRY